VIQLEFYDIFELLFLKLVFCLWEKDVTGEWRGWRITTMFAVKITEHANPCGLACFYQS
jgi:hypothetical protein